MKQLCKVVAVTLLERTLVTPVTNSVCPVKITVKTKGGIMFTFGDVGELSAVWSLQKNRFLLKSEATSLKSKVLCAQIFEVLKPPSSTSMPLHKLLRTH